MVAIEPAAITAAALLATKARTDPAWVTGTDRAEYGLRRSEGTWGANPGG